MVSVLVFSCHPKTTNTSAKEPSSVSFDNDRRSSLRIGSFGSNGRQIV
jgi:hypothetical protein